MFLLNWKSNSLRLFVPTFKICQFRWNDFIFKRKRIEKFLHFNCCNLHLLIYSQCKNNHLYQIDNFPLIIWKWPQSIQFNEDLVNWHEIFVCWIKSQQNCSIIFNLYCKILKFSTRCKLNSCISFDFLCDHFLDPIGMILNASKTGWWVFLFATFSKWSDTNLIVRECSFV